MAALVYTDIEIQGQRFATVRDAANHFGVASETIRKAMKRGTTDRIGCGKPGFAPLPVRIRGVDYPSAAAAADALGVAVSTVHDAVRLGRPDRIGRGPVPIKPAHQRQISIGTKTWPSLRAASRALGFGDAYIGTVLHRRSKRGWERVLAAAMALEAREAAARAPP